MDFSIGYHMAIFVVAVVVVINLVFIQWILSLKETIEYERFNKGYEGYPLVFLSDEEKLLLLPYVGKQLENTKKAIEQLENEPFNTIKDKREIDNVISNYENEQSIYNELQTKLKIREERYVGLREVRRAYFHR